MASTWADSWGGSTGAWLTSWDREATVYVPLSPPFQLEVTTGRQQLEVTTGDTSLDVTTGRQRLEVS